MSIHCEYMHFEIIMLCKLDTKPRLISSVDLLSLCSTICCHQTHNYYSVVDLSVLKQRIHRECRRMGGGGGGGLLHKHLNSAANIKNIKNALIWTGFFANLVGLD